jgi:hypothetical protein
MSTERLFSPPTSARGAPEQAGGNPIERGAEVRAGTSLSCSPLQGG